RPRPPPAPRPRVRPGGQLDVPLRRRSAQLAQRQPVEPPEVAVERRDLGAERDGGGGDVGKVHACRSAGSSMASNIERLVSRSMPGMTPRSPLKTGSSGPPSLR